MNKEEEEVAPPPKKSQTFLVTRYSDTVDDVKKRFETGEYNVNFQGSSMRQTSLHRAIAYGCSEKVVLYLLSIGADPTLQNSFGNTPLHVAIIDKTQTFDTTRRPTIIKALVNATLKKGKSFLDLQNQAKATALVTAAIEKDKQTIRLLLRAGANPNVPDMNGNTMMHFEALRASRATFIGHRYLGADVQHRNNQNQTAADIFKDRDNKEESEEESSDDDDNRTVITRNAVGNVSRSATGVVTIDSGVRNAHDAVHSGGVSISNGVIRIEPGTSMETLELILKQLQSSISEVGPPQ